MCKCNLRVVKAKAVSRTFPLLTGENSGGGHVLIQYEMMVNWERISVYEWGREHVCLRNSEGHWEN